jgi:hypothetical protein
MATRFGLVALFVTLSFTTNIVCGQTGPADVFFKVGCGAGIGHFLTDAERRFHSLFSTVFSNIQKEYYAQHRGALPPDPFTVKQLLRIKFDNRDFSCSVKLKSDGAISDLRIFKTSGSDAVDKTALGFIATSAPFLRSKSTEEQRYLVDFPLLTVRPIK